MYDVTSRLPVWSHVPIGWGAGMMSLPVLCHVLSGGVCLGGGWPSIMAFWLKVAFYYGLLVESDLLLWPSG